MTELLHRQAPSQRQRRLMITVDVEAQPGRAERDHVDRLIWGKFSGNRAGIGEMMDIADRHGVKTTMFLDYCEEHLYGDSLRDVAREIHRRGHDLQLHAHLNFLSSDWWDNNKIERQHNLNKLTAEQAAAMLDFLCERQVAAINVPAIGFRGGGYRFNECVLDALVKRGVLLDSSVNISRATQPVLLPNSKQFVWSNDCLEIPVSCVTSYRNIARPLNFSFNLSSLPTATSMVEYLDTFYQERGDDAIAVLVMHSWSFLLLTNNKFFTESRPELVELFSEFMDRIAGRFEVVTAREIAEEFRRGELSLDAMLDIRRLNLTASSMTVPQVNTSNQMPTCPICGAEKGRFTEMNGRRCPDCGSVERQRSFAVAYDSEVRSAFDVAGKSVLIFSPSVSELRFLEARGLAGKTSVDVRPSAKPDIIADVCAMPQIASESRAFIFASYLMPVVHDMGAALGEVARVLAPDGTFISIEIIATGRNTIEHYDVATITGWYGKEAFEQYKVGSYRTLGEDYINALRNHFDVSEYRAVDPITGQPSLTFVCRKRVVTVRLPEVDDLALRTMNELAADRVGKIVCLQLQAGALAGRVRNDSRFQSESPLISSWRDLATSDMVAKVAALSGWAAESADFIYGVNTFDFLPPLAEAVDSIARVLKPGGAAVLAMKSQRLSPDESPPYISHEISDAAHNLPDGAKIASMKVGRNWLEAAFSRHGLEVDGVMCGGSQAAFVVRKPADASITLREVKTHRVCNICSFDFTGLPEGEVNCGNSKCKSRPRTRTIPLVCAILKAPFDGLGTTDTRRLLAFAMPDSEYQVVSRYFGSIVSVSLYASYRKGHIDGVDVRDLSRFAPASFDGTFGVLLFDYFVEHEQALAEIMRVLKPGGILFTHIAPYRLTDGDEPPVNTAIVKKRPGYFEYIPDDANMPSIKVGRRWLLDAAERVGFVARLEVLKDPVSGESIDWLICVKPSNLGDLPEVSENPPAVGRSGSRSSGSVRASGKQHGPTAERAEIRDGEGRPTLVYKAKLTSNPDVRGIRVALSGLNTPTSINRFDFAEHVENAVTGEPTDTLILAGVDAIGVSNDLGRSWERVILPGSHNLRLWNCFTTAGGRHIVQSLGWQGPSDGACDPERHAAIFVFDKEWRLLDRARAGYGYWHGTASISQSDSTIMFGEYFNNSERYKGDFDQERDKYMKTLKPSAIWRSQDEGETWHKTIERGPLEIRHFHTVQADRYVPRVWWASTGDLWSEVRVWRSPDDGDSWTDVTNPAPDVELPLPNGQRKAACQRFTDMVIGSDRLIWGADDLLGPTNACDVSLDLSKRAGSRIYCSGKSGILAPVEVGYVGHPIRKFVDVGPGWIVMTEAKGGGIGLNPQVFFLGKSKLDLTYLFDVDNMAGIPTGFSYSRGSNRAKDGVFFTFKNSGDALTSTTQCLRWQIEFD